MCEKCSLKAEEIIQTDVRRMVEVLHPESVFCTCAGTIIGMMAAAMGPTHTKNVMLELLANLEENPAALVH